MRIAVVNRSGSRACWSRPIRGPSAAQRVASTEMRNPLRPQARPAYWPPVTAGAWPTGLCRSGQTLLAGSYPQVGKGPCFPLTWPAGVSNPADW